MVRSPNDTVLVDVADGVCTLTINRPDALNALDEEMVHALLYVTAELKDAADIRVVVVKGAGEHFMAGGDVKGFKKFLDQEDDKSLVRRAFENEIEEVHRIIRAMRALPVPIVASVRGAVAGAGFSFMLACDLIVCADDAVMTLAYRHIGVSPDGGSTWFLPRIVGQKKAMEIALLGERFGAAEASEMGLVNRVVPAADLDAEVAKVVAKLADGPRYALAQTKALLNGTLTRTLPEQLDAEMEAFVSCSVTDDFHEGVTAFAEKRKPRFS